MLNFLKGELLLLDKPLYWTSFDLVRRVRGAILRKMKIKKIKVGHAGTLDPLATGLMLVCTGNSTKNIEQFQNLDKEYEAEIVLGARTASNDLETDVEEVSDVSHISRSMLTDILQEFSGTYEQEPPSYSARLINGKRAYDLARKGKLVKLKSNIVHIYDLKLLDYTRPSAKIYIKCSKGTYIRALARDIGNRIKSGAYLKSLRRTAIGDYKIEEAMTFYEFEKLLEFL